MTDPRNRPIRDLFEGIHDVYDRFNHLLSLRVDAWWRYRMLQGLTGVGLDVAAGTGESTERLYVRPGIPQVVGLDIARHPLRIARSRRPGPVYLQGDGTRLPFPDDRFDFITVAFGIRNIPDRLAAFREFHRVLRPGGVLRMVEFTLPTLPLWGALYRLYLLHGIPRLAAWLAGPRVRDAYTYLGRSIHAFPSPSGLAEELQRAGFDHITARPMILETAVLYEAHRVDASPSD
ncbi:MAG: ubiquinone/menaquinone biosynthesis methyltransferase [Candidatus Hydrothermae bacterium]|nr:ubiquinone/menaquinone biosynthesis methyltransferase [Candidatus Hydrothermae bacterium]